MTFKKRLVTRRIDRSIARAATSSPGATRTPPPRRAASPPPETMIHRYDYLNTAALATDPLILPVPHMYSS
jgi:hypothetical protein